MIALVWDWHGLARPWDWTGITTHFTIEEVATAILAGILLYGKRHAKHRGLFHRFAHSVKAQVAVDVMFDAIIAITTIQIMHL